MAKIDIDKFVASIFKCCEEHGENIPIAYPKALKDQGLMYDNNKKEIVSISEPEQPTSELTELEEAISQMISGYMFLPQDIDHCVSRNDAYAYYKKCGKQLLSIARKQIVEELEDYKSDAPLDMLPDGWFVGVEDCINKIKEGSI